MTSWAITGQNIPVIGNRHLITSLSGQAPSFSRPLPEHGVCGSDGGVG